MSLLFLGRCVRPSAWTAGHHPVPLRIQPGQPPWQPDRVIGCARPRDIHATEMLPR